jgi:putative tricarboxylic transport membrane protein
LRIRGTRDFYGGLALVALALLALWGTRDLGGMQGFAFGPGTAPRMFAILLAAAGLGVSLTGILWDGPALERFAFRGPALVVIAILAFAAMIRPLGLVVSTYATFMISIFGSSEMRLVESLIAAALMTMFCVALFVYLLQLPFQLWPAFLG